MYIVFNLFTTHSIKIGNHLMDTQYLQCRFLLPAHLSFKVKCSKFANQICRVLLSQWIQNGDYYRTAKQNGDYYRTAKQSGDYHTTAKQNGDFYRTAKSKRRLIQNDENKTATTTERRKQNGDYYRTTKQNGD